jgi:hypothetical protein
MCDLCHAPAEHLTEKGGFMARRVRTLSAILVVAGIVGVAAGGAAPKFPFFGPFGGALCNGGGVVAGTEGDWGFVHMTGTSKLHASVKMQGLDPNTTYIVRFIQGVPDCGVTDATFTTNGNGKGHASISEAAVSTHAYIFVENIPATQFYVTETYWHTL